MYCLDTNIIIDLLRGDKQLTKLMQDKSRDDFAITSIALCELFRGAYRDSHSHQALKDIQEVTDNMDFLTLDKKSCDLFGKIHARLHKIGKPTQEADLFIASITLSHNAILVTRNPDDFKNIESLRVETW